VIVAVERHRARSDDDVVWLEPLELLAFIGPGRHLSMQADKIAGSDFEQPKAGPKGGGQDARSNPTTLPTVAIDYNLT